MKEIELIFIPKNVYVRNMQSHRGKANIFYKDEPTNPHDPEAVQIFTLDKKKEEIFLGYIKKNEVNTIFTDEANELYSMAECGEMMWEDAKLDENWAKVKEVIKTPIFKGEKLEQVKKDIAKGIYRFRYDYDAGYGYLFKKE